MIDHKPGCTMQVKNGKCDCKIIPEPPKGPSGIGGSISINQPSNFEYRVKAFEFALQCSGPYVETAAKIEDYLRNGYTK